MKKFWICLLFMAIILVAVFALEVRSKIVHRPATTIDELQEILDAPRDPDIAIYEEIRRHRDNMTPEKWDVQRDRMAKLIVQEAHKMMKLPMKVPGGVMTDMSYNDKDNLFVYDYNIDNTWAGLKALATPAMVKGLKKKMIADMYRKHAKAGTENMIKILGIDTYFQYHSSKGEFVFRIIITADEQPR
jgi:hypothetical protein